MPLLTLLVFSLTLFVSASLLFLVQPMLGKLLLPYLGGTPAVWNACMVFFQVLLLAGYLYAHALSRWFSLRTQWLIHGGILLAPLAPLLVWQFDVGLIAQDWRPPPTESNPIPWLLIVLLLLAGLPFFVVSTSAPLLQKWFAGTAHPTAQDPYFLYGASNVGSMLALLSYPVLIETNLGVPSQTRLWTFGYVFLALLIAGCAWTARRFAATEGPSIPEKESAQGGGNTEASAPSLWRRLRWIALATVPSSLMLGVTTYLTTDIAAVPFFWIIPLALYLLSFIMVFSRLPDMVRRFLIVALPVAIPLVVASPFRNDLFQSRNFWLMMMHWMGLYVVAMVCHGELARSRPPVRYLTEFYLWISFGGALGGIFNTLIAPQIFVKVIEYPLMMAAACVLLFPLPKLDDASPRRRWLKLGLTAGLGLVGLVLGGFLLSNIFPEVRSAIPFLEPFRNYAKSFAQDYGDDDSAIIYEERNFFGYFSIWRGSRNDSLLSADTRDPDKDPQPQRRVFHTMYHGTTIHGKECMDEDCLGQPLTYFHRDGPIGHLFETVYAKNKPQRVAVLGLGAGTLAGYMKPGWELTLYEIDPAVVRVAEDPNYFTYLTGARKRGVEVHTVLGDGRLQIQKAPDQSFDLIFMDAFTSDAVPVHLITKEALELYSRKLAPDGLIVVNVTNRFLNLEPVLGNLAEAIGMVGLSRVDPLPGHFADAKDLENYLRLIDKYNKMERVPGSHWLVLARDRKDFGALSDAQDAQGRHYWQVLHTDPAIGVWTDNYSNLLKILKR